MIFALGMFVRAVVLAIPCRVLGHMSIFSPEFVSITVMSCSSLFTLTATLLYHICASSLVNSHMHTEPSFVP